MHDDTTATPLPVTGPDGAGDPPATTPLVAAARSARDLCMSVFDRWRCGLDDGHVGMHVADGVGSRTSWNDAVSGRMLREL